MGYRQQESKSVRRLVSREEVKNMKMRKRSFPERRILAFVLALFMILSSVSFTVFGASEEALNEAVLQDDEKTVETVKETEDAAKPEEEQSVISEEEKKEEKKNEGSEKGPLEKTERAVQKSEKKSTKAAADPSSVRTVSATRSGSTITVKGTILDSKYIFLGFYIDDTSYLLETSEQKSFSRSVKCSVGYHRVVVFVVDRKDPGTLIENLVYDKRNIAVPTTSKPTYKGVFRVYAKSLTIYPYNMAGANQSERLYLEYKAAGAKTWKRSGYMTANAIKLYIEQGFKIKGLKANKKYKTRLRYGTAATRFDGSTGVIFGPVLNTGTIKTGQAKKPKVKSVTVKAVKVKFHKHRVAGHYYWTGYHYVWIGPYTEKYYTCKLKVTVKLKKKPGTKGIWINGKFVKGNKKTYKATFTPYPNYFTKKHPKGMKYKVKCRSFQSKKYYGFSPIYKKKKKVK